MPFVQRDAGGNIIGVFACLQPEVAEEELPQNDAAVVAYLTPPLPIDLSNVDNLERTLKALALLQRQYANQVHTEVRNLAVLLVQKGVITAAEANGLTAYVGAGGAGAKTVAELKADFAAIYSALP